MQPTSRDPTRRHSASFRDLLELHAANPARYPYLLESVARGASGDVAAECARYDILFAFPGDVLSLSADGTLAGSPSPADDFLSAMDAWWKRERLPAGELPAGTPFRGGWFVFLAYEVAALVEPVLDLMRSRDAFPVACAVRVPAAIVRDHANRSTTLVCEPGHEELLSQMEDDLQSIAPAAEISRPVLAGNMREDDPKVYLDGVERIKRYIRAGDVFQVNLSRAWTGRLAHEDIPHWSLYQRLRRSNPSPFAGLAVFAGGAVISSSPERLFSIKDNVVDTRPIAGTYPRNADAATDRWLSSELLRHPKERAEHIMLIDLERNDLGRVCDAGTVTVSELMVLESYAHVHHIVSNVRGRLARGLTPIDVVRAVFPGGTITGCPKVRCMQIIAELEQAARGPYTGAMGYINRDGSADFNILIRTISRQSSSVSLRTGAGIVADSVARRELSETRQKALGVIRALEGAPA